MKKILLILLCIGFTKAYSKTLLSADTIIINYTNLDLQSKAISLRGNKVVVGFFFAGKYRMHQGIRNGFGFFAVFSPTLGNFEFFRFIKKEELARKNNVLTIREFLDKLKDNDFLLYIRKTHIILVNVEGEKMEMTPVTIGTDLSSEG